MAELGRCLLFYVRHAAEMERLYEAEEPNVKELPDPDSTLRRIRLVGDAACRDAVAVLNACAAGIEERFRPISTVSRVRNRIEDSWDLRFRVKPKGRSKGQFEVGVGIQPSTAAFLPWVWCPRGLRGADEIIRILGKGSRGTSFGLGWSNGSVGLDRVPIPQPESLDAGLNCDSQINQVLRAFDVFTRETVSDIAAFVSR